MKPEWLFMVRDQCKDASVPMFFKQWGAHGEDEIRRRSKHEAGRLLDGREWNGMPAQHLNEINVPDGKALALR